LLASVGTHMRTRDKAEPRAEIDTLKAEHAQAHAERKAKLQARIDHLSAGLQDMVGQAKRRSEEIRRETEAKV